MYRKGSEIMHKGNESPLSWRIVHIAHRHRATMEKCFESTGIFQGQHRMLMCISENDFFSQKEIAAHMRISTATVAVSLKKLEKGGYIEKKTDENDNRLNKIKLTEKGKSVVEYSKETFEKIEKQMFDGFTDEEKGNLIKYLDRIEGNLKNEG